MFRVVCFNKINRGRLKPVHLSSFRNVWNYVNLQKRLFPEIRIYDNEGFLVVRALEGKVVIPHVWSVIEHEVISQL